jgi:hypothetical protein
VRVQNLGAVVAHIPDMQSASVAQGSRYRRVPVVGTSTGGIGVSIGGIQLSTGIGVSIGGITLSIGIGVSMRCTSTTSIVSIATTSTPASLEPTTHMPLMLQL